MASTVDGYRFAELEFVDLVEHMSDDTPVAERTAAVELAVGAHYPQCSVLAGYTVVERIVGRMSE